jgi:hypothetical protein
MKPSWARTADNIEHEGALFVCTSSFAATFGFGDGKIIDYRQLRKSPRVSCEVSVGEPWAVHHLAANCRKNSDRRFPQESEKLNEIKYLNKFLHLDEVGTLSAIYGTKHNPLVSDWMFRARSSSSDHHQE